MISILRPRRGKKATAETQNIVLKRGEVFFESPDTGVGTGTGRIKIGDGTTPYKNLPYFIDITNLNIDVDDSAIQFEDYKNSSSYSIENIIKNEIASGKILKNIISAIKYVLNSLTTNVNTNTSNITSLTTKVKNLGDYSDEINNIKYNINTIGSYINILRNMPNLFTARISHVVDLTISSGGSTSFGGWFTEYENNYGARAISAKIIEIFSNETEASGYIVTEDLDVEVDFNTYSIANTDNIRLINRTQSSVHVDHILIEVVFGKNFAKDKDSSELNLLDTEFKYTE